jgi:hypothetical protein
MTKLFTDIDYDEGVIKTMNCMHLHVLRLHADYH